MLIGGFCSGGSGSVDAQVRELHLVDGDGLVLLRQPRGDGDHPGGAGRRPGGGGVRSQWSDQQSPGEHDSPDGQLKDLSQTVVQHVGLQSRHEGTVNIH